VGDVKQIVSCPFCEGKSTVPATYNGRVRCKKCTHQFTVAEGQINSQDVSRTEPSSIAATSQFSTTSSPASKIVSGISILLTFWIVILIIQLSIIVIANLPTDTRANDYDYNADVGGSGEPLFVDLAIALGYFLVLAPALVHIYALKLILTGVKELFLSMRMINSMSSET